MDNENLNTTQIYTHLQEFQVRAAIEENPLGSVSHKKASLDTTPAETGERGNTISPEEEINDAAHLMEAFTGAAQEGIRSDTSEMTAAEPAVPVQKEPCSDKS